MTNKERRDAQMAYISDESIMEEQADCRKKLQKLNFMDRSDFEGIASTVKELLGKSEDAFINPPFYCDYGTHIEVGKNFFANYNCTILDALPYKSIHSAPSGSYLRSLLSQHPKSYSYN